MILNSQNRNHYKPKDQYDIIQNSLRRAALQELVSKESPDSSAKNLTNASRSKPHASSRLDEARIMTGPIP